MAGNAAQVSHFTKAKADHNLTKPKHFKEAYLKCRIGLVWPYNLTGIISDNDSGTLPNTRLLQVRNRKSVSITNRP